jgi:PHD/YefM family antitoxin component YafN of YafNO toxin-antitoxin module
MKTIQMPKELQPLLSFAEASEQDTVVFTEKSRPVAALVSLRKLDRESLALSTNAEFWRIIETARKQVRAGQTITLEALEKKYGAPAPNKARRSTPKPAKGP